MSNRELDAINEAQVPVKRILDQEFTRKNFQQAMTSNSYQVVHLATHGQFGATRERTYLLAADDAIYVDQLSELFRTRGQSREDAVELLVLSACKTASGNDRAVLGIAGTAVQAGARSVIAGLWSLADDSSVLFAQELYKIWANPEPAEPKPCVEPRRFSKTRRNISTPAFGHLMFWWAVGCNPA
jgi:CHAT domain-containing protein